MTRTSINLGRAPMLSPWAPLGDTAHGNTILDMRTGA
jgi:hypothetical protein